jgi:putative MATE family efflux protein
MTTMALYNITDTFWLGRLGYEAIAALTVVLPYQLLMYAVAVGSGIGINSLASRRFGERNPSAANHIAGQAFPITAIFGGMFILIALFGSQPIIRALGANPDITDYTLQYFVIINLGAPFVIFSIIASNLLRGSGDAIRPMIFLIGAAVINIALDPLLIFGIGPFPEMGIRGAALATVISQLLSAGLSLVYVLHRKSSYNIKPAHLKPDWPILRDIYRVGFPSMLMQFSESLCFIIFNNVLSSFGSLALAAAGLAIRVADLAFMPIMGVADGLLPIVGFNFGARLWKRLWGAVKIGSVGLMVGMAIAVIILEILAPYIIPLFNSDPALLELAVPAMRLIIVSLPLLGPMMLFIATFQGLSKGVAVLVLSLARQIIFFLPALYLLPLVMGLNGAWLALPLSDILGFALAGLWLLRERRVLRSTGVWHDLTALSAETVN